ncbi:MAG TPA: manganese efflux pump MntP family protein [Spirochaetota bacterium]|nr:manganese efflux pump MntP family protein [Spirochaetota bacterium]
MDLISITGIAVALAMDAFSVSIAAGMMIEHPTPRHYFRLAFHFGLFQFLMPVIGYLAGVSIEGLIRDFDHWIAMAVLAFIGIKMIRDSYAPENTGAPSADPSRGWTLVLLSIATSIDALAVGLSIGVLGKPIMLPSIIIGMVCALFSVTGIALGKKAGEFLGRRVLRFGGIILIAIGVRIVIEHMA